MKTTGNSAIIPGSIIIIKWGGINYLIDGQHRYQLIKEMMKDNVDLNNTYIVVEEYECETDSNKANVLLKEDSSPSKRDEWYIQHGQFKIWI